MAADSHGSGPDISGQRLVGCRARSSHDQSLNRCDSKSHVLFHDVHYWILGKGDGRREREGRQTCWGNTGPPHPNPTAGEQRLTLFPVTTFLLSMVLSVATIRRRTQAHAERRRKWTRTLDGCFVCCSAPREKPDAAIDGPLTPRPRMVLRPRRLAPPTATVLGPRASQFTCARPCTSRASCAASHTSYALPACLPASLPACLPASLPPCLSGRRPGAGCLT